MVHVFGIVGDGGAAEFADDFKDFVIVVHGILEIVGRVVVLVGFGIVAFFQGDYFLHQRMAQVMLKVWIVSIKVSHNLESGAYLEFFL